MRRRLAATSRISRSTYRSMLSCTADDCAASPCPTAITGKSQYQHLRLQKGRCT